MSKPAVPKKKHRGPKGAARKSNASVEPPRSPQAARPSGASSGRRPTTVSGPRIVEAKFVAAAQQIESLPPPVTLEVAFAGRSNVGKSSLLNCLMQRQNLVRTSSTPGCTRHVGFYEAIDLERRKLHLVDLPGYGYAKRSKAERATWALLLDHYFGDRPSLMLVVLLIDVRRGIEADDQELLDMVASVAKRRRTPLPVILVATKLDRLSHAAQKPALTKLQLQVGRALIGFSAKDATGREELLSTILRITFATNPDRGTPTELAPEG